MRSLFSIALFACVLSAPLLADARHHRSLGSSLSKLERQIERLEERLSEMDLSSSPSSSVDSAEADDVEVTVAKKPLPRSSAQQQEQLNYVTVTLQDANKVRAFQKEAAVWKNEAQVFVGNGNWDPETVSGNVAISAALTWNAEIELAGLPYVKSIVLQTPNPSYTSTVRVTLKEADIDSVQDAAGEISADGWVVKANYPQRAKSHFSYIVQTNAAGIQKIKAQYNVASVELIQPQQ